MRYHFSLLLILFLVFSIPNYAYADIYEYIDDEGMPHYTDFASSPQYVLILQINEPVIAAEGSATSHDDSRINSKLDSVQLIAQIDEAAQRHQLDSELIHAVIHVESAYKQQATSRKGAQGLMQLMPATAQRLGVKNSYDPAQNIEGGTKYLKELLTMFNNDISLAVAAYNAGEQAVIRYGNRIPPYKETQAYVPKVMSIYNKLRHAKKTRS